jgi:hypothetical protein
MKSFYFILKNSRSCSRCIVLDSWFHWLLVKTVKKNRGKSIMFFNSSSSDDSYFRFNKSRTIILFPIYSKTRLKNIHYGMSGGHLFEASLLLKLMIERKYEIKSNSLKPTCIYQWPAIVGAEYFIVFCIVQKQQTFWKRTRF